MDYGSFVHSNVNKDGKTPFDVAETQEMKNCLKSFGIKPCDVEDYNSQQRRMHQEAGTATGRDLAT
jgi:hypothetical protein